MQKILSPRPPPAICVCMNPVCVFLTWLWQVAPAAFFTVAAVTIFLFLPSLSGAEHYVK